MSISVGSRRAVLISGGVRITGVAQVGQVLMTRAPATWSVGGVAKAFLAPSTSYVPVPGDVGKSITATIAGVTSDPTAAVIDAPLPVFNPTLPYGARTGILADSIGQQNAQGVSRSGDATQGGAISRATGEITQALALDPRINAINWYDQNKGTGTSRFTDGSDQGVNGQTSTQIAARVSDLVARNVQLGIVAMGTNNTTQASIILADIATAVSALRAAGAAAIVATIRPNALANESVNRSKANIQAINASIRSYVAGLNDPLVKLWDAYKQYDRGDGYIDPLDTYDRLLHPNEAGAELGAWGASASSLSPYSLVAAIRSLVQPGDVYADLMAANPNVIVNPTLTGAAGTLGAGFTGVAPTSWRWEPQSAVASTVAVSVLPNAATGGQSAKAVITPSGSAAYERINFRIAAYNQNVSNLGGKWARLFAEVETDGTPWLMAPSVILTEVDTATAYQSGIGFQPSLNVGAGNYYSALRPVARRRLIMSEPVLLGPNATALSPSVQFAFMPAGATGTASVYVHRTWMATVPDPRPAWGVSV
ncbi:SGNH/GDSL hydrolase family protein [Caulobacter segnis]|uniref:SGNH hydrolase-type esterase domain-containing protein n=1 Tax=Caulobacter segnis TaxID=88688 RepID=A0A2W5VGY7_9CAUL|nr:SGNH/GDSL hydrolase family protein [Caulobacter segnis]PZR37163.1 MAG: hypothetical protein DI526_01210 [Caulobacter segnis]